MKQGDIHSCRKNNNGILNEQRRQWAVLQAKAAKKSKSIIQFSIYISFDYHSVAATLISSFHDLFSVNIIVSRISLFFKNRVWHFSRLHFFFYWKKFSLQFLLPYCHLVEIDNKFYHWLKFNFKLFFIHLNWNEIDDSIWSGSALNEEILILIKVWKKSFKKNILME